MHEGWKWPGWGAKPKVAVVNKSNVFSDAKVQELVSASPVKASFHPSGITPAGLPVVEVSDLTANLHQDIAAAAKG